MQNQTLALCLQTLLAGLGRIVVAPVVPSRTAHIMAQVRTAHRQALAAAVGPKAHEKAFEAEYRAHLSSAEKCAKVRKDHAALWARVERDGRKLEVEATRLMGWRYGFTPDQSVNNIVGGLSDLRTVTATIDAWLTEAAAVAAEMTTQELRWHPTAALLIGKSPAELRKDPVVGGMIKRVARDINGNRSQGKGGRPRKVRAGTVPVQDNPQRRVGLRECGVDGKVGNLPTKVDGCTCGGYGFNGAIGCAGHGFAVRPQVTYRHPLER